MKGAEGKEWRCRLPCPAVVRVGDVEHRTNGDGSCGISKATLPSRYRAAWQRTLP